MCGIIGILSRAGTRTPPRPADCAPRLAEALGVLRGWSGGERDDVDALEAAVRRCEDLAGDLRGFAGLRALLAAPEVLEGPVDELGEVAAAVEARLDREAADLGPAAVERLNAVAVRLRDAWFTLARDRLGNLAPVRALAGGSERAAHLRAAYYINVALNALDRLEVRGRDSAGIHLQVRTDVDTLPPDLQREADRRSRDPHYGHAAVRRVRDDAGCTSWGLVYKVAAEVGELGDNVASLRGAIERDALLHRLLEAPGVEVDVLGHTRWASVGLISEANAHPLDQELLDEREAPGVVAALNGDVDNYQALIAEAQLAIAPEITTDAKVIPALVSRHMAEGHDALEAFRHTVARFEGSVAIAAATPRAPGRLHLALRGSGQALYVGLAEDAFVVASEPYGVVEETSRYLRMGGETPSDPSDPASRGQVVVLDAARAGTLEGIRRVGYDGRPLPVAEGDLARTEITTRDVDRGDHRHYLHKEMAEAPESVRKTLRGRFVLVEGAARAVLGEESLPAALVERLAEGEIRRIRVIGQGTAAVAGKGVADAIRTALAGAPIAVDALPATEVSGFQLEDDMRAHLYVAISQSGTTTDTNRTVDLLRARGAAVIGIVNRRDSDLTERVDAVLYTSDGRDVEMSVASTKAFYSQIAAGFLLADALARACGAGDPERRSEVLRDLAELPGMMRALLEREAGIAEIARETAPPRRHWALVGNGRNRIAAEEIRIKLSELCYKSIACDATEDKKHIDLSSEPLVLVCAAGLSGGTASDVAKEVEIYAAHKACPVVIASDGSGPWHGAAATIRVPGAHPALAYVLATMAGHLFGYHAAQAIDALALPLREARGRLEVGALDVTRAGVLAGLRESLEEPFRRFAGDLQEGRYDGALEARTATRLSLLFHYATGRMPLEVFTEQYRLPGTPGQVLEGLAAELTRGIDELSRPIDAIKHQAKTVTVGISRGDEALWSAALVRALLEAGAQRELLVYDELRVLVALDAAVADVLGHTRYAIDEAGAERRIRVVGRGGIGERLRSRVESDGRLRGTKNTVAEERRVLIAVGRSDGRPIILVPELTRGRCTGMVLLHVRMREDLDAAGVRAVLAGYRNRYGLIRDAVTETNAPFQDEDLLQVSLLELLTEPVLVIADRLIAARTP